MKLIKYRDAGMSTYTYFWVREEGSGVISPYFDSEEQALTWAKEDKLATHEEQQDWVKKHRSDPWDEWKSSKDIV